MKVRWIILAGTLLVIIVVFAFMPAGGRLLRGKKEHDGPRSLVVVKRMPGSAAYEIPVYAPLDGAKVSVSDLPGMEFRWGAVRGARRYVVLLNNEVGELVWRASAKDTTVVMPDRLRRMVLPGGRLKWVVQVPTLSASSDLYRIELTE